MYDTYYQTRVNTRWGRSPAASILGLTLFLIGIASIIFSSIDISSRSIAGNNPDKPNIDFIGGVPVPRFLPTIFSDYSIWATLGKGIWVGILFLVTGFVAICSQRERTSKAIAASTLLAVMSAIFALFLMLSSIPQLERYRVLGPNTTETRNVDENTEYVMNALLIASGVLAFLVASLLACLGCCVDSCVNVRSRSPRGPIAPRAFGPQPFVIRPRYMPRF